MKYRTKTHRHTEVKNENHVKKSYHSSSVSHSWPRFLFLLGLKFIHSAKHVIDHFQGLVDVQFHTSCFKLKALLKPVMWPEFQLKELH